MSDSLDRGLAGEDVAGQYDRLWDGGAWPDLDHFLEQARPLPPVELAAVLCADQRHRWQTGQRPPAEFYLHRFSVEDPERVLDLIYGEYLLRERLGERPDLAEFLLRFPDSAALLRAQVELHRALAEPGSATWVETADPETTQPAPGATPVPDRSTLWPTLPDYEILGELGRGGMGVVYRARQASLDRVVALKMILAGELAAPEDVQRFHAEARTAAGLHHPGIVAIHEVGEHHGQHFFTMDLVDGPSLADQVRDTPLPPRQAARIVRQVAEAIQYAHERGVLHRDLKTANVLLDQAGRPHVTDFGLARSLQADKRLTVTGAVLGTPSYMPPEQVSADRGRLGPASDVYALGAVLYELITSRPPFRAATAYDTLVQVLNAEPAPPRLLNPAVDRDLETIVLKCLQKEPDRRYASARLLGADLQAYEADRPIQAPRPGLLERSARWLRRNARTATLVTAAVLLGAIALGGGLAAWGTYREATSGSVVFDAEDDRYLEAEVWGLEGRRALLPFTIPSRQPQSLSAGEYEIRFGRRGQLTRSAWLTVPSRQTLGLTVGLPQESELRFHLPAGARLLPMGDRADLFLFHWVRPRRIDGRTGKTVWGQDENFFINTEYQDLWSPLVAPDGSFLLCARRNRAELLAVSLADGAVLWQRQSEPPAGVQAVNSAALAAPLLVELDGDGTPDEVAVHGSRDARTTRAWVEAVSGRTGKPLWRQTLDLGGPLEPEPMRGIALTLGGPPGQRCVAVACTRRLVVLDARTGEPRLSAQELAPAALMPPRFIAAEGGELWLASVHPGPAPGAAVLSMRLVLTGKVRWEASVAGEDRALAEWNRTDPLGLNAPPPPLDWPRLIAVNDAPTLLTLTVPKFSGGDHGLEARDLRSGEVRWHQSGAIAQTTDRIFSLSGMIVTISIRNLEGVSRPGVGPYVLAVTALDPATGKPRWQRRHPLPYLNRSMPAPSPGEPQVWGFAGSGQPLLVVPVGDFSRPGLALLDSFDGRQVGWLESVDSVQCADADGDGLPDLLVRLAPQQASVPPGATREFRLLRGGAPEVWRRLLDAPLWLTADLDGDGVRDGVTGNLAVSGETGRILWQAGSAVNRANGDASQTDLNGDGVPDFLVPRYQNRREAGPLTTLSGKDGQVIWETEPLPPGGSQGELIGFRVQWLGAARLEPSGPPCVLAALIEERRGSREEGTIVAFEGADGRLRWRAPGRLVGTGTIPIQDLNGDRTADVIVPIWDEAGYLLRALDGRGGQVLWERRNPGHPQAYPRRLLSVPGGVLAVWADNVTQFALALHAAEDGVPRWVFQEEGRFLDDDNFGTRSPLGLVPWGPDRQPLVYLTRPARGGKTHDLIFLDLQGREFRRLTRIAGREPTVEPQLAVVTGTDRPVLLAHVRQESWAPAGEQAVQLRKAENVLVALADLAGTVRWQRPVQFGEYLWRVEPGRPETAILAEGELLTGLDATTGRPLWRCRAAGERIGLLDPTTAEAPRLLFRAPGGVVCRRALPVDEQGRYISSTPGPVDDASLLADPLRLRRLPWAQVFPQSGVPPAVVGVALLAPAALLILLVSRRWRAFVVLFAVLILGPIACALVLLGIDAALFRRAGESYASDEWYFLPLLWSMIVGPLFLPIYLLFSLVRWVVFRARRPAG